MELIATCAFGLEKLVYDEIKKLNLWVIKKEDGRVIFEGDERAMIRANLRLRCVDRIQIKIGEFEATTFDQLFDSINDIEWEKFIGPNDVFPVEAVSVKCALHSEPAIQSIVKKAIVKRLQKKHKTEILPENSGAVYQIIVKSNKDQFLVSIDSSGESLHKRGYRTKAGEAPMKETLAAAMIMLSDWTSEKTLIDPFCGSGTIAIEAAMMARNMAPGLKRAFAFHNWQWINSKKRIEAYEEATQEASTKKHLSIRCFDIDPNAIKIAKENARLAEQEDIEFTCSDFKKLDFSKFKNCTFITNPPYGNRLENMKYAEEIYHELGKKFSQTKNSSLFLITPDEKFQTLFGKHADKNRKLYNGNIRCYLYSFLQNKKSI